MSVYTCVCVCSKLAKTIANNNWNDHDHQHCRAYDCEYRKLDLSGGLRLYQILKLKKRDVKAAEYVGAPAQMILAYVSDEIRNRDLDEKNNGDI